MAKVVVGILVGLWTVATWGLLTYIIYAYAVYPATKHEEWGLLPGICCDLAQTLFMYGHFIGATIMILIAPFQLTNALWKTRVHHYTGILFVIGAVLTSMCGIIFMNFNETVGGNSMTVPFTVAGVLLFVCALQVVDTVWNKQFDRHRRWVFRLYLQGTASVFYRVLYAFAFAHYGMWKVTFHDSIDWLFNWLYFLIPGLTGEIGFILYYYVNWPCCRSCDPANRIIINQMEEPEKLLVE